MCVQSPRTRRRQTGRRARAREIGRQTQTSIRDAHADRVREKRGVVAKSQAATCQEASVAQIYSCGHQQSDAQRHDAELERDCLDRPGLLGLLGLLACLALLALLDFLSNESREGAIPYADLHRDCHPLPTPRRLQLHQLHHHHSRVQALFPALLLLLTLYMCTRDMPQGGSRIAHILKRQRPGTFHIKALFRGLLRECAQCGRIDASGREVRRLSHPEIVKAKGGGGGALYLKRCARRRRP